jgi:hypothetical protein
MQTARLRGPGGHPRRYRIRFPPGGRKTAPSLRPREAPDIKPLRAPASGRPHHPRTATRSVCSEAHAVCFSDQKLGGVVQALPAMLLLDDSGTDSRALLLHKAALPETGSRTHEMPAVRPIQERARCPQGFRKGEDKRRCRGWAHHRIRRQGVAPRTKPSATPVSPVRVFDIRAGVTARVARRRDRYPCTDGRARADRAADLERAAEHADAVGEPA